MKKTEQKILKQVYIDTETTGINPKDNGLIQISGMIEIDSQMVKEFDFRVKPFLGDKIEDEALKVNGITREDLEKFESPDLVFEKLIALFNQYVNPYDKSDKFFFIAYNARFDWDFLSNFFLKNNPIYRLFLFLSGGLIFFIFFRISSLRRICSQIYSSFSLGVISFKGFSRCPSKSLSIGLLFIFQEFLQLANVINIFISQRMDRFFCF